MKTYTKWFAILLFATVWVAIIGPMCMNAHNDIAVYAYPIITLFGVGAAGISTGKRTTNKETNS